MRANVVSYNAVISAGEKTLQWELALTLLREIPTVGWTPDGFSYNGADRACGRFAKWEKSLALLREMPTSGITSSTVSYNTAIKACARSGQWRHSVALLRKMPTGGFFPDGVTHYVQCSGRKPWHCLGMLTVGTTPDVVSYNSVISVCGTCRELEETIAL